MLGDDADAALFAQLNAAERRSLVPQRHTIAETLAQSSDPRMAALSGSSSESDSSDVPFLLSLLSSNDAAVLEAAADALWKQSISGPARTKVHKANGARPLVALLAHSEARVVRAAAGAVSILALDAAQRTTILSAGGASALAAVLENGGDREAEQAARAVANLSADEPTRASLVDQSAPRHLATILRRRRSPPGLREAVCRAIGSLAAFDAESVAKGLDAAERAATQYAEAGGSAPLIDCLQQPVSAAAASGSGATAAGVLPPADSHALGGVSSSATHDARSGSCGGGTDDSDDSLEGHPVSVSGVAARPELNGQRGIVLSFHTSSGRFHVRLDSGETVALRPATIAKLTPAQLAASGGDTANTPLLKAAVRAVRSLTAHRRATDELVRLGALPSLITLLGSRVPEIAAAVASSVGAIAAIHAHRATIAASRGVAMLLRCLGEGSERSVQEPACAALRILALEESVRETLADAAALVPVVAVLSRGDAQAREAAAGLLGSVAAHPSGRRACLDAGAVPPLVKLLPLRHEPTQEAAARAIKNLAFTPDGATQVTKAGGTQPLVRMLKSGSEPLHLAASAALEVLTMEAAQREELLASVM